MSSIHQEITLPRNLLDYIADRDAVIYEIETGRAAIRRADDLMKSITRTGLHGHAIPRDTLEESIRQIDRDFWRIAFDVTGFLDVMDATEKAEFFKSMQGDNVPPFSESAVRSTFVDLMGKRDEMFRRGVVRVFQRLSGNYRSHSAFRVQRKMVLSMFCRPHFGGKGMVINQFGYGSSNPSDAINDLDRVLCAIEEKPHKARALESAMNDAWGKGEVFDDGRLKAKSFKNQNVHLELRADLVDGVNRIIAEHYGAQIATEGAA